MNSDIQNKKTLSATDLAQFTGTEQWYRHSINRTVLYTDGVRYVAEHGQAYWLLDEIALIQPYDKSIAAEEFQVWKLEKFSRTRLPPSLATTATGMLSSAKKSRTPIFRWKPSRFISQMM